MTEKISDVLYKIKIQKPGLADRVVTVNVEKLKLDTTKNHEDPCLDRDSDCESGSTVEAGTSSRSNRPKKAPKWFGI